MNFNCEPEPSSKGSLFTIKARGNLKFDILKSGIQKGIRRGLPDLAVPLALRGMELGNKLKAAKTNILNRLIVIAGEDIGVASLPALRYIDEQVSELRTKSDDNQLINIVAYMCSQPKTRYTSWLRSYWVTCVLDQRFQHLIPKNIVESFSEASLTVDSWEKMITSKTPYLSLAFAARFMEMDLKVDVNMKELDGRNTKKVKQDKAIWMKMYHMTNFKDMIKMLYKWYTNESEKHIYMILAHTIVIEPHVCGMSENTDFNLDSDQWKETAFRGRIQVPEYVVDWHTRAGKIKGSNKFDFAMVGSHIENEHEIEGTSALKDIYVEIKKIQTNEETTEIKKYKPKKAIRVDNVAVNIPTEAFNDTHSEAISRDDTLHGQILTSRIKPCTYMIRGGVLKGKVIKGPFRDGVKINKFYNRYRGFKLMRCDDVVDITILKDSKGGLWIQSDILSDVDPSEWEYVMADDKILGRSVKRVVRESIGSRQLKDLSHEDIYNVLFGQRFLYRDFLISAVMGSGDQGDWNTLVTRDLQRAVLIDYEDSSGRKEFTKPGHVYSKTSKRMHDLFERGYSENIDKIKEIKRNILENLEELKNIGAWDETQGKMVLDFIK